ncbi:hypothetical protein shn_24435 (plasmid) [Shinella sp. HZN7]|nr:hypothetical protein shn_24435 [Shinella sp. HZN7]
MSVGACGIQVIGLAVSSASVFSEVKRIHSAGNMPLTISAPPAMKRSGRPERSEENPGLATALMAYSLVRMARR